VCLIKIELSARLGSSQAWIGFTGATGGLNECHDILSWSFEKPASDITCATTSMKGRQKLDTNTNFLSKLSYISVNDNPNFDGILKKIINTSNQKSKI